jgi:hypothetical protein
MLSQGERVSIDPVLLIRLVLTGLPSKDVETRRLGTATKKKQTETESILIRRTSHYVNIALNMARGLQNAYI